VTGTTGSTEGRISGFFGAHDSCEWDPGEPCSIPVFPVVGAVVIERLDGGGRQTVELDADARVVADVDVGRYQLSVDQAAPASDDAWCPEAIEVRVAAGEVVHVSVTCVA
jgi:hypothetical protein